MATGRPDPLAAAEIHLVGVCLDCRKRHEYRCAPADWLARMGEWRQKHLGHRIEFRSPRRKNPRRFPRGAERPWEDANRAPWWLEHEHFGPNADIRLAYVASGAYTITLASLATSSTLVAGRESDAVSNSSNLYLDYLVGGKVRVGTTPTTNTTIEVWFYAAVNDTPTYPDVFDGTDSAETVTSVGVKQSALRLAASLFVDSTTSDRDYWVAPTSLAAAHGGLVPFSHGVFVTHSTAVNLNSTGGNHVLNYKAAYMTSS